jgi:hypothetical protein
VTGQAIAFADLVVLPIRPLSDDLETVRVIVDRVEALQTPFVFLVNQAGGEDDFPAATVIELAQHGTVCPVILPERGDFAAGQAEGRTVMEIGPDTPSSEDMARLWDYLSNQEAKVAPAARDDRRGTPDDRRHFRRHNYDQNATFTESGMVFPCRVRDISAGGVSILAPTPPVEGMEMILHVPYLGEFLAKPVHIDGERAGLEFLIGADAQTNLIGQLEALLCADPPAESGGAETGDDEVGPEPADQSQNLPQAASA